MIVLQKTVETPPDRSVFLKIPRNVPEGTPAVITISVFKQEADTADNPLEKFKLLAEEKTARRKACGKRPFEGLYGILKDSAAFSGDPVEIVRKMREEWDAAR
ncbi:MAG: hypothetical protein Pg6A_03580 [Termitinemataceae bacterium]|nr:MAG: hypothetical protein Pg6A_03580 [Termitinemataceae bacterium]